MRGRSCGANTTPCLVQVSGGGKAKYDAKRHALVWKFKKFPGESEASLMASVELIATTKEKRQWARPPIQLQFQVRRLPVWPQCTLASRAGAQHVPCRHGLAYLFATTQVTECTL